LERKKDANLAFFYDFIVDDHGKLIYIFCADATSRKNYSHFDDVVSFDTIHRFCMWHIMEKVPKKVGHPTNRDLQFWDD
jgi:hypothetical protein